MGRIETLLDRLTRLEPFPEGRIDAHDVVRLIRLLEREERSLADDRWPKATMQLTWTGHVMRAASAYRAFLVATVPGSVVEDGHRIELLTPLPDHADAMNEIVEACRRARETLIGFPKNSMRRRSIRPKHDGGDGVHDPSSKR